MLIRGITVSIGYGPLLRITLAQNVKHFSEYLVITSPEDAETQAVAGEVPGVGLHVTDAASRYGARFNKGLCFEECWDVHGRDGWWLVHDADIILPPTLPLDRLMPDAIHGARRRILEDPARWRPDTVWATCPLHPDGRAPIGYFQLFDGEGPHVKGKRPWYDVSFPHGGGSDAYFLNLFPGHKRRMLPIDVLHLGPTDTSWFGVDQAGRDMMARFVHENGWQRAMMRHSHEAVARAGELPGRVRVPGYDESSYELPFVRRARTNRGRRA